jgi:hypothetical protein
VAQNIAPYLFVSGFMLAPAYSVSQTEATPYEPGGMTSIQGSNLITGTVGADRIVANSITTSQITAAGVNADRLVANSITAAQIAANTITAAQIGVGALTAGTIAANAITASKLQIASVNLLYNTEFAQRLVTDTSRPLGISWASNGSVSVIYNSIRTDYCPSGFNAFSLGFSQASVNGVADIYAGYVDSASTTSGFFPASPNVWYEASAYLSVLYGGSGAVLVSFYAADRSKPLSTVIGSTVTVGQNGVDPKTWEANGGRSKLVAQAPANTAYITVSYRWGAPTSAASTGCYLFVSGPMLAAISAAQANAGEVSPYQEDGVTSISGTSITTASINASAIIANSITAGQIAAGTITATQIATRTITANNLVANTITSNEIAANTIVAGNIAAGAISTTQLAASAITADKLGVGLNSGNLFWNSDFLAQPNGAAPLGHGWATSDQSFGNNTFVIFKGDTPTAASWNPTGLNALQFSFDGKPTLNAIGDIYLRRPASDGSYSDRWPVVAGQYYEFSAYASVHRQIGQVVVNFYDVSNNLISAIGGNGIGTPPSTGALATYPRSGVVFKAPANTATVTLTLRSISTNEQSPYIFWSAVYFGNANSGQTTLSAWTPQSNTVIQGGQVATNSLNANKIVAGSITSDKIAANTITASNIAAGTITGDRIAAGSVGADRIVVGSTTLNSWVSGSDTTRINGGSIAANSITANLLKVGARGVTTVDLSFYIERDGNGALTNVLAWTAGYVNYTNNDGSAATVNIPAARVAIDGGRWYVYWPQGNAGFGCGKDIWPNILNDPNNVLMASVSSVTGLSVFTGGTIIDGTRITTRSIQADQIAANQIQTVHMAANSISGDRIVAGSLAADRITSGTISAGVIYIGFDNCFWMDANPGLLRMKNRGNGVEQVSLGYIGYWTGDRNDYGIIIRDQAGNEKLRANSAGVAMDGAIINNASIGTAKIANLAVDNLRIADGAVTQCVAVGSSATTTGISIALRGSGRVLIQAYFNGNSASGSEAGPGAFLITRDQGSATLANVNAAFALFKPGSGNTQYYPAAMAIAAIDAPGAGTFTYRCQHTNGQGIGGLLLVVTELSK